MYSAGHIGLPHRPRGIPGVRLRRGSLTDTAAVTENRPWEEATAGEEDRPLCCSACRHPITTVAESIVVDGAHCHTCRNPAGLEFVIGCFGRAEGCRVVGPASEAFTWFPGFAWSLALCAHCRQHLGWHYRSGEREFFGLIVDRLVRSGSLA